MTPPIHSIGAFIDISLWREAHKLLDFQIRQRGKNHGFSTLSMFYYERLNAADRNYVATSAYFETFVASNLFYGLSREFAATKYLVPKAIATHREYLFLTFPLRVLYYAVGLYLVRVSEEFAAYLRSRRKHITSYYGGHLRFEGDRLVESKDSILYYKHYKSFKSLLRRSSQTNVDHRVVIRLDIANFYGSVSIQRLLDLLRRYVKAGVQSQYKFDDSACDEIRSFVQFIMGRDVGIPMFDNDVVSGAIGDLLLKFGDLACDDALRSHRKTILAHRIVRYVDDIYLIVDLSPKASDAQRIETIYDVLARVADDFHTILGLSFNSKGGVYWLSRIEDRTRLLDSLKRVSPNYYASDDDDESPQNRVDCIINEIREIGLTASDAAAANSGVRKDVLREVFDKSVRHLLQKPSTVLQLESAFDGFDFNAVSRAPRELTVLICVSPVTRQRYRDFLLGCKCVTYRDANLILTYLCQIGFADGQLLALLGTHRGMAPIMTTFHAGVVVLDHPGYFKTVRDACARLAAKPHVIHQIKLRRLSEGAGLHGVALNHLLNEIHALAHDADPSGGSIADYKADDVAIFCYRTGMPNNVCMSIRNLFELRNRNPVSHPGSTQRLPMKIDSHQYEKAQDAVAGGIPYLLQEP